MMKKFVCSVISASLIAITVPASAIEPLHSPFLFNDLKALLANQNPQSIQELLRALPSSYLRNSVFVEDSQSLQASDPSNPRVLLFGNGELVISFNGTPAQRGYEAIEVMHLNRATMRFELNEFTFEGDLRERKSFLQTKNLDRNTSFEWQEIENRSSREGTNPDLCLQCHGQNPRPIIPKLLPTNNFPKGNARLETLQKIAGSPLDQDRSVKNGIFASLLTDLNFRKIARKLVTNEQFKTYEQAIFAALANRGDVRGLLPPDARDTFDREYLSAKKRLLESQPLNAVTSLTNEKGLNEIEKVSKFVAIVKGLMKMREAEEWAPDGSIAGYDFSSSTGGISNLAPILFDEIRSRK